MPVVLKYVETPPNGITVDSTVYTVDSTELTADMQSSGSSTTSGYTIVISAREIVDIVNMEFFNELKEKTQIVTGVCEMIGNYLSINFMLDIVEGDSFQLTIKDLSDNIIWKGKAYSTAQTDLQNYTLTPTTSNNIIKI